MVLMYGGAVECHDGTYTCIPCAKAFKSLEAIFSHCKHSSKHAWCNICQCVLANQNEKALHDRVNHKQTRDPICAPCNLSFRSEDEKQQHDRHLHHCCGQFFTLAQSKRDHLVISNRHNACLICHGYPELGDQKRLKYHMEAYHFQCPACKRYQLSEECLKVHMRKEHSQCWICKTYNRSEEDPNEHLARQHFQCPICKITNRSEDDLNKHLVQQHFQCSICKAIHRSEDELKKHLTMHDIECPICKSLFNGESQLEKHMAEHMLKCPACPKRFNAASAFFSHLDSGSCFSSESLKAIAFCTRYSYDYTRTLSDTSPYVCPQCNTRFTLLSALYLHVEDYPNCAVVMETESFTYFTEYIISEIEDY